MAEVAVAVANAAPDIQARADVVLSQANGVGVRALVSELLEGRIPDREPRLERRLHLGYNREGTAISVDPFALIEGNLGIVGASGSGKSWLAGLLVEELLKQGYQVCVVDPEGDYRAFRTFSQMLLLGGIEGRLPAVDEVTTLLDYTDVSLVLDLSTRTVTERRTYVSALLRSLAALRDQRGRPHWFLIDETQSFCPPEGSELTEQIVQMTEEGGIGLISYRPSLTAPALLATLDHWICTRLNLPEELETMKPFLSGSDDEPGILAELAKIPQNQAFFKFSEGQQWGSLPGPDMVTFQAELREIPHIRHLHKYLRAPLPESKRFYFRKADGYAAANLWEFRQALNQLPIDSIKYHLERGDFERWLRKVLHDHELARRIRKTTHRGIEENERLRQSLVEVVANRYAELESLV